MMNTLGGRLKELRVARNLSQKQIADYVGVNDRQISAYENDTRQPSYDILISLANLYGVSTDYLLGQHYARVLDVSDLTDEEYALVAHIVKKLKEFHREEH